MFDLFHHRARAVTEAAETAGVQLADGDPLNAAHAPFEPFHRGQLQEVERTLWRSGDTATTSACSSTATSRLRRPARPLAALQLRHRVVNGLVAGAAGGARPAAPRARRSLDVGGTDIQLESDEFNEACRVHGPDQRFAYAFLDAGMQEFRLAKGRAMTLQLRGTWLRR